MSLSAPRSPGHMFTVFSRMALQGFGGVLPVAQRDLVERERWLSKEDFLATLSLCQVLPGPNVVNLALIVGQRHFGWRGAMASLAGMIGGPLVIVLILAASLAQLTQWPAVTGALRGMGIVAAGLIVATALKLVPALRQNVLGWPTAAALVLATVLAIGWQRWPLLWVVLGLGGGGMALAAWRLRRAEKR